MRILALSVLGLLAGCASAPSFTLEGPLETPSGASISTLTDVGRAKVEAFFGQPFAEPVRVIVSPTRKAFDASLPATWELTPTQCWMVGVGGGSGEGGGSLRPCVRGFGAGTVRRSGSRPAPSVLLAGEQPVHPAFGDPQLAPALEFFSPSLLVLERVFHGCQALT